MSGGRRREKSLSLRIIKGIEEEKLKHQFLQIAVFNIDLVLLI